MPPLFLRIGPSSSDVGASSCRADRLSAPDCCLRIVGGADRQVRRGAVLGEERSLSSPSPGVIDGRRPDGGWLECSLRPSRFIISRRRALVIEPEPVAPLIGNETVTGGAEADGGCRCEDRAAACASSRSKEAPPSDGPRSRSDALSSGSVSTSVGSGLYARDPAPPGRALRASLRAASIWFSMLRRQMGDRPHDGPQAVCDHAESRPDRMLTDVHCTVSRSTIAFTHSSARARAHPGPRGCGSSRAVASEGGQ